MPPYNKSSLYLNLGCCVECRQGPGSLGQRPTCDAPSLPLGLFSAEVKNNSRSHKKALFPVPQSILLLSPTRARATHFTGSTSKQYHHGVGGWFEATAKARTWSKRNVRPRSLSRRQDGQGEAATLGPTWKETCLPLSPKGRSKTPP